LGKCRKHWPAKISDEERDQIAKIALWNSIRKYDSRHGTKFTSYLTAQIKFEYMNYVNKYNAGDDELTFADMKEYKDIATYNHNYDEVDIKELINRLPPKVRKIVSMRYYGKYTLSEIGSQLNYSPERIRQLVVEGLKEMHEDAERVAA
jgi:RNA polymerase sigma factor (sigma-70 family)